MGHFHDIYRSAFTFLQAFVRLRSLDNILVPPHHGRWKPLSLSSFTGQISYWITWHLQTCNCFWSRCYRKAHIKCDWYFYLFILKLRLGLGINIMLHLTPCTWYPQLLPPSDKNELCDSPIVSKAVYELNVTEVQSYNWSLLKNIQELLASLCHLNGLTAGA